MKVKERKLSLAEKNGIDKGAGPHELPGVNARESRPSQQDPHAGRDLRSGISARNGCLRYRARVKRSCPGYMTENPIIS